MINSKYTHLHPDSYRPYDVYWNHYSSDPIFSSYLIYTIKTGEHIAIVPGIFAYVFQIIIQDITDQIKIYD